MADDIPQEPGIRELKARLSDYVGRAVHRDEPVFVTRNNRRVIALVPAEIGELVVEVGGTAALVELVRRARAEES